MKKNEPANHKIKKIINLWLSEELLGAFLSVPQKKVKSSEIKGTRERPKFFADAFASTGSSFLNECFWSLNLSDGCPLNDRGNFKCLFVFRWILPRVVKN